MNKRQLKKVLILALILLLLSMAVYLQKTRQHKQKSSTKPTSSSFEKLLEVLPEIDKLQRIAIERQGGARFELSVPDSSAQEPAWQLDSPKALSAREGSIEALAYSVLNLKGKEIQGSKFDLNQEISQRRYGFDQTWLTIDLFVPNDESESELVGRVLLGGEILGVGDRYATVVSLDRADLDRTDLGGGNSGRVNLSKRLFRISKNQVERLGLQPDDLRNRSFPLPTLLSNQQEHLQVLELRSRSDVMRIEYKDEKLAQKYSSLNELQSFLMTKPYPVAYGVDQYQLEQLLQKLPNPIKILKYIEDEPQDLSQYGLREGQRQEFYARDNSGKSLALWLGIEADRESIFAKQPNRESVFTIGKEVLSVFNFEPFKIVDKFVILLNIDRVDRIQLISEQGPSYSLKVHHQIDSGEESSSSQDKIQGGELFAGSALRSLNSELVKDLYQEFLSIFFVGQVPDSFFPVDKAKVSMIYSLREGKKRRADFYNYSINDYYVVSLDGGKATFLVEKRILNELQQVSARVLQTGQLNIVQ